MNNNKELITEVNLDEKDKIINPTYILDPLTVIIKLVILANKPIGTKIAVHDNIIYIQEIGIFQSFVRYIFKKNKYDVQYLYNPIELACKHFLSKEFLKQLPNIKVIFLNAQKGLQNLIKTYSEHSIITHTLYMYYNIISNYLSDTFNDKLFISDNITPLYTDIIVQKFIKYKE